ncbi:MAG: hypothetical protein ACR2K2_06485 [Mycobacteriales bacterium]
MPADRTPDLVLYGASGFIGRLAAAYLAEHAPVGTRLALAGRSLDRLAAVRDELGERAAGWDLLAAAAGELTDTTLLVVAIRGGLSGGTLDSLRTQLDVLRADRSLRRLVTDPYTLSPDRSAEPDLPAASDTPTVGRENGWWIGPFVMAPFNTRIVRRSNALQHWAYGRQFRYREALSFGSSPLGPLLALGTGAGILALGGGLAFGPTRGLLDRLLPAPGEGPSRQTRDRGHAGGERSGLALDPLSSGGGVLTPATAMGAPLADRLRAAGFTQTTERLTTERV